MNQLVTYSFSCPVVHCKIIDSAPWNDVTEYQACSIISQVQRIHLFTGRFHFREREENNTLLVPFSADKHPIPTFINDFVLQHKN